MWQKYKHIRMKSYLKITEEAGSLIMMSMVYGPMVYGPLSMKHKSEIPK